MSLTSQEQKQIIKLEKIRARLLKADEAIAEQRWDDAKRCYVTAGFTLEKFGASASQEPKIMWLRFQCKLGQAYVLTEQAKSNLQVNMAKVWSCLLWAKLYYQGEAHIAAQLEEQKTLRARYTTLIAQYDAKPEVSLSIIREWQALDAQKDFSPLMEALKKQCQRQGEGQTPCYLAVKYELRELCHYFIDNPEIAHAYSEESISAAPTSYGNDLQQQNSTYQHLEALYTEKFIRGQVYRRNPPGRLDLRRLTQGLPCWQSWSVLRQKQPKTLILADWRAVTWTQVQLDDIKDMLKARLQEGFIIYWWQANQLMKLTLASVDVLDKMRVRRAIEWTGLSPHIRRRAAKLLRQPEDTLHILDAYHLDKLLPCGEAYVELKDSVVLDHSPAHPLSIQAHAPSSSSSSSYLSTSSMPAPLGSAMEAFSPSMNKVIKAPARIGQAINLRSYCWLSEPLRLRLRALLMQASIPVISIIDDWHIEYALDPKEHGIQELLTIGDNITIKPGLQHLALTAEDIKNIIKNKILNYKDKIIDLGDLYRVKRLTIDFDKDHMFFSDFFQQFIFCSNMLSQLEVELSSEFFAKNIDHFKFNIKKLKSMDVSSPKGNKSIIYDGVWHRLDCMAMNHFFKSIDSVSSVFFSTDRLPLSEPMKLSVLNQVKLSNTIIHGDEWSTFSQYAKQLSKLSLISGQIALCDSSDRRGKKVKYLNKTLASTLLNLTNLSLIKVMMCGPYLGFILKQSPNIKQFKLDGGEPLSRFFWDTEFYSYLQSQQDSGQEWQQELSHLLQQDLPYLSELEELYLKNYKFDWENLIWLLRHTKALRSMVCKGVMVEGHKPDSMPMLAHLETLNVSSSIHNKEQEAWIIHLLSQTPRLKSLTISDERYLINQVCSQHLIKLKIKFSPNWFLLQYFIQHRPRLTHLIIDRCFSHEGIEALPDNALRQLEIIEFKRLGFRGDPEQGYLKFQRDLARVAPQLSLSPFSTGVWHLSEWVDVVDTRDVPQLTKPLPTPLPQSSQSEQQSAPARIGSSSSTSQSVAQAPQQRKPTSSGVTPQPGAQKTVPTETASSSVAKQPASQSQALPTVSSATPSRHQSSAHDAIRLDADTQFSDKHQYHVKRIFFAVDDTAHPDVNQYRLHVYHHSEVNPKPCDIDHAFILKKQGGLNLKPCTAIQSDVDVSHLVAYKSHKSQKGKLYYGKHTFQLNQEWQPIPSLSAYEQITDYHIAEGGDVDIQYSARDHQYYIRGKNGYHGETTLDWLVRVPPPLALQQLPQDIQTLIQKLSHPSDNPIRINKPNPTGQDYLDALEQEPGGACRHRAFLFQQMMQKQYPHIPVNIICNDTHAYVEIYYQNQWFACQLGGYPAKLTIDESAKPVFVTQTTLTQTPSPIKISPTAVPAASNTSQIAHGLKAYFVKQLRKRVANHTKSITCLRDACEYVFSSKAPKRLLMTFADDSTIEGAMYAFYHHAQQQRCPVFYAHTPEDLRCQLETLLMDESGSHTIPAPSGKLYDFLCYARTLSPPQRAKIAINYNTFAHDDFAQCHTLLERYGAKMDGIGLPVCVDIIGLINIKKQDCYRGEDFWGRFDTFMDAKNVAAEAKKVIPYLPVYEAPSRTEHHQHPVINLYEGADWKEQLLGTCQLTHAQLKFRPGWLKEAVYQAITNHQPIEIANGLWDDPEFEQFWRAAYSYGSIDTDNGPLPWPKTQKLLRSQGYDWEALLTGTTWCNTAPPTEAKMLNPMLWGAFLERYCAEAVTEKLIVEAGWIDIQSEGSVLPIYLTRTITASALARLLTLCQHRHIQPQFYLAPGVVLPAPIAERISCQGVSVCATDWMAATPSLSTQVIASCDPLGMACWLSTVAWADVPRDDVVIIDVSELSFDELVLHEHAYTKDHMYYLQCHPGVLPIALAAGKKVVLTGHFSEELVDMLAPWLIARAQDAASLGQLVLLPQDIHTLTYLPVATQTVTPMMIQAVLTRYLHLPSWEGPLAERLNRGILAAQPLPQLLAQALDYQIDPSGHYQGQAGYTTYSVQQTLKPIDFTTSAMEAEAFIAERKHAIEAVLAHSPYVFLTGPTGAGKTGFVQRYMKDANTLLFEGEDAVVAWATSEPQEGQRSLLFLDEADLSKLSFEPFRGLFHRPSGMMWQGKYYPLSSRHKFMGAGNGTSYGGERKLSSLFTTYGCSQIFSPMPLAFIYEKLLKPKLDKVFFTDEQAKQEIARDLLDVYQFLIACSRDPVLISPRELEMMLILAINYHQPTPHVPWRDVVGHYRYVIASSCVPAAHRARFDQMFKPSRVLPMPDISTASSSVASSSTATHHDFSVTHSRLPMIALIQDLLLLRDARRCKNAELIALLSGGLGGLLLEGGSGVGKTKLIQWLFNTLGYQVLSADRTYTDAEIARGYYFISMKMDVEERRGLLLKAFDEGAIVVMDEINTSPLLEDLLNALLMGKTPDGKEPNRAGFLLLGMQNPPTFPGRIAASQALSHRWLTVDMPMYEYDEVEIMVDKLCSETSYAQALVAAVKQVTEEVKTSQNLRCPNMRDIEQMVEKLKLLHESSRLKTGAHSIFGVEDSSMSLPAPAQTTCILQ